MNLVLRVTEGPDAEKRVPLPVGRHVLGRSLDANITFNDPQVSWEHAVINVTDSSVSLTNLSAHGTQIKSRPVTVTTALHLRDPVRLSPQTVVVIEAAETGGGGLATSLLISAAVVVVIAAGYLLLFSSGPPHRTKTNDWTSTYLHLERWVDSQAHSGTLPPRAPVLFRNGWRMERQADHERSAQAWLELMLMLRAADRNTPVADATTNPKTYSDALDRMLVGIPTGQESAAINEAALRQFAQRSYDWNYTQARKADE